MKREVRPPRPEEAEQFFFISAYSFDEDRSPESLARQAEVWPLGRCLAAYNGGTMVAGLRIRDLTMRINGGAVRLGGVADVSCLPEHRREGHVGALLTAALEKMRADGQALSGLGTPFPALYRKYGWEYANRGCRYQFGPKDAAVLRPPASGRVRRVEPDLWATLDDLYRRHASERNGCIDRDESWWRTRVLTDWEGGAQDIALWEEDGEPAGYLVYRPRPQVTDETPWPRSVVWVRDFVALTPDALSGLLVFLLQHDRAVRFDLRLAPDFPLTVVLDRPNDVHTTSHESLMLRIVDVKGALEARPALPVADGAAFTIRIADAHAPWNAGVWGVEAAEGRVAVERTSSAPDLECDIGAFAPLYSSHRKPRELALAGALAAHDTRALDAAERVFAAKAPPWTQDWW